MFDVVELGPGCVDVGFASKDHGDVLNDPLAVQHDELMAEGVRLSVLYQSLHVVDFIKSVDLGVVEFDGRVDRQLPDANQPGKVAQEELDGKRAEEDSKDPGEQCWVAKRVVVVTDHCGHSHCQEQDAPSCQTDHEVELAGETHRVE